MEVVLFLYILVIFLVGYGVVSQALLYKKLPATSENIFQIIQRPYWQMYGELMLEQIEGNFHRLCISMCLCLPYISDINDLDGILIYSYSFSFDTNFIGTDIGCNATTVVGNDGKLCPKNSWLVLLLLASYMLVTNILLINLLIAVFR